MKEGGEKMGAQSGCAALKSQPLGLVWAGRVELRFVRNLSGKNNLQRKCEANNRKDSGGRRDSGRTRQVSYKMHQEETNDT